MALIEQRTDERGSAMAEVRFNRLDPPKGVGSDLGLASNVKVDSAGRKAAGEFLTATADLVRQRHFAREGDQQSPGPDASQRVVPRSTRFSRRGRCGEDKMLQEVGCQQLVFLERQPNA